MSFLNLVTYPLRKERKLVQKIILNSLDNQLQLPLRPVLVYLFEFTYWHEHLRERDYSEELMENNL